MNSIIEIAQEDCCGCLGCAAICPFECISYSKNELGFTLPVLDTSACTQCGLCLKVCPSNSANAKNTMPSSSFWAYSNESERIKISSSGGLFSTAAKLILTMGGAIFGAEFCNDCHAVSHSVVSDLSSLENIIGSKYVQSDITPDIYHQVETRLAKGQWILLSGTPCQINSLISYLDVKSIPTSKLISISVFCHGVPSPLLWEKWTNHKESTSGSVLRSVNFREKDPGWENYSIKYVFEDSSTLLTKALEDWYMRAYIKNYSLRPSCFNCLAKKTCRADIMLGDFWGIRDCYPYVDCSKGVSAVLCFSNKGEQFINSLPDVTSGKAELHFIEQYNPLLFSSPSIPKSYPLFQDDCIHLSIGELTQKWDFKNPRLRQVLSKLCSVLNKLFR